jgi:ribosomal protein S18 acetylase RimI-like enzyme
VIAIRRARTADAEAVGAVTVAAWRSAYASILPPEFLAGMSARRQGAMRRATILDGGIGHATFVAIASGEDAALGPWQPPQVIGFASGGRLRGGGRDEGEIETLYVLDDYRDQGLGRRLMRAAVAHLNAIGCRSVRLWVLRDNPSRWFYQHLGGRLVAEQRISVGGQPVVQQAMRWDPISLLMAATAPKVGG